MAGGRSFDLGQGVVEEFDAHRGLGKVRGEDGRELGFHCTQIADGSRTIEVGTAVSYEVRPGHGGRWEAAVLTRCASPAQPPSGVGPPLR